MFVHGHAHPVSLSVIPAVIEGYKGMDLRKSHGKLLRRKADGIE